MPRIVEFDREGALKNAMDVFWEKGYHGTSMQDLVDATGLNRSSIYNSFGSKLELYQLTLSQYQKETGSLFQRALVRAKNPLEAIKLIFEGFLPEIMDDKESKGCFSMNCKAEMGNQEEGIRKWLLRTQEDSLTLFQELIKDGQEQGLINSQQDHKSYAHFVFSAFQGYRMTGILIKDREVLNGIIENTLKVLM